MSFKQHPALVSVAGFLALSAALIVIGTFLAPTLS
jgi:hypothetical protein